MRFGVYAPASGEYDVPTLCALARAAEAAGWDGFFLWDNILATFDGSGVLADTTVALAAIALATERLRFGALVTPIARRRPWKFAKETATLDRLSDGRLIVGAGLGGSWDFAPLGEGEPGPERAARYDDALALVERFWTGDSVDHRTAHFAVRYAQMGPRPVQRPRIPVWIGGYWPGGAPFRRAARWDGVAPLARGHFLQQLTPEELAACVRYVAHHRERDVSGDRTPETSPSPFDVVFFHTATTRDAALVDDYAQAGATWWLEATYPPTEPLAAFRRRIGVGPPC